MADEVGFMMSPSVKKTWAKKACTPVVPYRNRRQKKVSVLGAVVLHSATGEDRSAVRLSSRQLRPRRTGGGVPAPCVG